MQRHRDRAQKAAEHTKSKEDPRMATVQTILQSVQVTVVLLLTFTPLDKLNMLVF